MNLNQLRYFVSVARLRSFTKAAEFHFISQAAITQQIKSLEETVGFALLDRKKRPIELTPAGNVFYREARAILDRADAAIAKAAEAATGITGSLRVGYAKGYERSDLSERLGRFHRAYPNILISCFREDTDTLASMLRAGELDLVFSWEGTNLLNEPGFESRLDLRSPLSLAVYSSHPFAGRDSLMRADLKDEVLLYYSPSKRGDSAGDAHFMRLYERAGFTPRILLKSNDIESVLMMVAAEEGVSIIPSYSIAKIENAINLVFIPLTGDEEYEDVHMMWRADGDNVAVERFVGFEECETGCK